jgi:uncharacterized protein YecE (DUF72 family)
MSQIFIGTCSWTDKQLINAGTFYPQTNMSAEARLRWYSHIFPIVEVDSSYYAIPSVANAYRWVERTPSTFQFHLKMFRLFTGHWCEKSVLPKDLQKLAPDDPSGKNHFYLLPRDPTNGQGCSSELRDELIERFIKTALVLESYGKLGVILLQLAPWVTPTKRYYDYLLWIRKKLEYLKVAIEFRNPAWIHESLLQHTVKWLRHYNFSYVSVDAPQGTHSSMPPLALATNEIAYVRLHGRNVATWQKQVEHTWERFDWYYSGKELNEWVPRIRTLKERANEVHVLFNPNRSDQGPRGALLLAKILGGSSVKEPGLKIPLMKNTDLP